MSHTILTVDDSASVRQVVSFALRDAGDDTLEAVDGRDALTKLTANIRLIITDLNMPNMGGLELIKQVRGGSANKYVPIVVLTTESQADKKQEAKSAWRDRMDREAIPPRATGGSRSTCARVRKYRQGTRGSGIDQPLRSTRSFHGHLSRPL